MTRTRYLQYCLRCASTIVRAKEDYKPPSLSLTTIYLVQTTENDAVNSYFTQNIISVWHWSICIRYKSFCRQKIFFNIKNDHCSMEIYLKWNIWGVQPSKYRLCMPNQPCYVPVWHMHLETSSLSYKCNTQNKVHKFICWKFWQQ